MPAKGGAFFGFAIIVAAALITWGIIALVEVANDDSDDSGSSSRSSDSADGIQDALNNASPGDIILIPEGTHEISLTTTVSGTEEEPIRITCEGSSRDDCVLKGDGDARVLEILHSWYIIEEFTIDGQESSTDFAEQLIFVQGTGEPDSINGVETGLTGITIRGMNLYNAGKECIRFRYFVTNSVVDENDIGPCGVEDFQVDQNNDSNGEGVYIGTALNQIDSKGDEYPRLDVCTGIVVMNNRIDTQGSEAVDIKEGSFGNVVYRNDISGQMDENAGGVSLRGDRNVVYFNKMSEGEGHCVRIGGDEHDSDSNDSDEATDYGKNNEVYRNTFDRCESSYVKVNESPQIICENDFDPDDDVPVEAVTGDAAASFPDITATCSQSLTDVSDLIRVGTRFDFGDEDDDSAEEGDDAVVDISSDRGIVGDGDYNDDSVEENDDSPDAAEAETGTLFDDDARVGTNDFVYRGCFFTSDAQTPAELFDQQVLVGETADMSVNACILGCVGVSLEFAGLVNGSQCWCGSQSQVDFSKYGNGICNIHCSGSTDTACGGLVSFSLYQIFGDGGIDSDDQGDDDGGIGVDEANITPAPAASVVANGTPSPVAVSSSVVVVDQADDGETPEPVEEEDDDAGGVVPAGVHEGCYRDNVNEPILEKLYEDTEELTPASCIESCRHEGEELAGLQDGSLCFCGTTDEYKTYGSTTCSKGCSGDPSETCGGEGATDVWTIN